MPRAIDHEARDRQMAVACRLGDNVLPEGAREPWSDGEYEFVSRVLREESVTPGDFRELDDHPGGFPGGYDGVGANGPWHARLRRWRNNAPDVREVLSQPRREPI